MQNINLRFIALLMGLVVFFACKEDPKVPPPVVETPKPTVQVNVPAFDADTAYAMVKKQVDFGPRVPNTKSHKACSAWLIGQFKAYGLEVIEQRFNAKGYTGVNYESVNIIAQYKPEQKRRIMIAAHWDSRFHADKDTKTKNCQLMVQTMVQAE